MGAQLKGGCQLLNENIRAIRKVKGLPQEELALRLHVARQTVSKWEQGLSALYRLGSPCPNWNDSDPERAVFGAIPHACEYLFVRCAPVLLIGSVAGACLTRRRARGRIWIFDRGFRNLLPFRRFCAMILESGISLKFYSEGVEPYEENHCHGECFVNGRFANTFSHKPPVFGQQFSGGKKNES